MSKAYKFPCQIEPYAELSVEIHGGDTECPDGILFGFNTENFPQVIISMEDAIALHKVLGDIINNAKSLNGGYANFHLIGEQNG